MMNSYKIKNKGIYDISFCNSNCTDISCSRCHMSNNYANMIKYSKESGMLHSESDFSIDCADYKKPIFTVADDKVV